MKFLFISLLVLALAIIIGSAAGTDSGYVLMTIYDWEVQTSVTMFIITSFLFFCGSYFVTRNVIRLWLMPKEIRKWRRHRNQRRAEQYLTDGLQYMTEGDWRKAERAFCKAAIYSCSPYINYLYAAHAAQALHTVERRDEYLRLAYHHNPSANIAVGLTQARLQLNQEQTEQALATLKHLQHEKPKQKQVKQLLLNTYTELGDWRAVLKLIPEIDKSRLLTREQVQAKQLEAYSCLLREVGKLHDKEQLSQVWSNIPKKLQQHLYLIEVYVSERLNFAGTDDCEVLLRAVLKRQWDKALIRLYGLVEGGDSHKQLKVAESWLNNHLRDAVLLLSLARLCMRNELWGKARDYFQESLAVETIPETYYELASLHEREGEHDKASSCYEKGLALATKNVPSSS